MLIFPGSVCRTRYDISVHTSGTRWPSMPLCFTVRPCFFVVLPHASTRMNPFRYTNFLKPGQFQTVMIADSNYLDASFAASDSPTTYDILDSVINTDIDDIVKKYARERLETYEPGTPCLVKYIDQRFYRAYVLRPSPEFFGEEEVYFVDYGNVWSALPRNIYIIDRHILDIPVAIFRCKLVDADDRSPMKCEMIASYIKEMTNIERSFATIDVVKVEDNTHYVKLFHHSMDQYLYFNDYINKLIAQVIDEAGDTEDVNLKKKKTHKFCSESEATTLFTTKPSNHEAIAQLISRVIHSTNVFNDDDVPLLHVEITNIVSPFEFYIVPDLKKTKNHYKLLYDEINREAQLEMRMEKAKEFHFEVPSELLAYYHQQNQVWRRGRIVKVTPTDENQQLNEYTFLDYDDFTVYKSHIMKQNIFKYIHQLASRFCTKSQALHCIIPNCGFAGNDERLIVEGIEYLKNYLNLHRDNLFILPLAELNKYDDGDQIDADNKFIVNLYVREMMFTGLFEAQKQHFESYLSSFRGQFSGQMRQFSQVTLPFQFDFHANIYRNLCSINMFDVEVDEVVQFQKSHYKRVLYPNTKSFSGEITYYNSRINKLYLRYENHQAFYKQILDRLAELTEADKGGKLRRIEKTIVELYPCVVFDNQENNWYRCEIVTIIEEKQAPWLPKIKVRLVDSGRTVMYYIEDLRDVQVMPSVPMLAVPGRIVGHLVPEKKVSNSIGKTGTFTWTNFPNLPMNIYIDSIED